MFEKNWFWEIFIGVFYSGVEGVFVVVFLVLIYWVVFFVFIVFVGWFINGEYYIDFGRDIFEVVKFIYFLKLVGYILCEEMVFLFYYYGIFLYIRIGGVIEEVGFC